MLTEYPLENVSKKSVPEVYHLRADGKQIVVAIHAAAYDELNTNFVALSPRFQRMIEDFDLPILFGPDSDCWGYSGVFTRRQCDETGWQELTCCLPEGLIQQENQRASLIISASLSVLFQLLRSLKQKTDALSSQLLHIDDYSLYRRAAEQWRRHTFHISARVSFRLCLWLRNQPEHSYHPEITESMIEAFHLLDNEVLSEGLAHSVHALCRQPQWINFNTVGNACGLDPENYTVNPGRGYRLLPHNVDSVMQQLMMLVGLAKLYEVARRDLFAKTKT